MFYVWRDEPPDIEQITLHDLGIVFSLLPMEAFPECWQDVRHPTSNG